jgi:hypothetical protein
MLCTDAGVYWPAKAIDRQIEDIVVRVELAEQWQERCLGIASEASNLVEMRNERGDLERRRQRYTHLFKEGLIQRDELDREIARIENRLLTLAPAEVTEVELALEDFSRFRENWSLATPEEKHDIVSSMVEKVYVDMEAGNLVEIVPKPGFKSVLEGLGITKPSETSLDDFPLVIGDPDGVSRRKITLLRFADSVDLVRSASDTEAMGGYTSIQRLVHSALCELPLPDLRWPRQSGQGSRCSVRWLHAQWCHLLHTRGTCRPSPARAGDSTSVLQAQSLRRLLVWNPARLR